MAYHDEPPRVFKCGHPRTRQNMRFTNGCAGCKECLTNRCKAYKSAHPHQRTEYRRRLLLAASSATRPHLYPSKQAA